MDQNIQSIQRNINEAPTDQSPTPEDTITNDQQQIRRSTRERVQPRILTYDQSSQQQTGQSAVNLLEIEANYNLLVDVKMENVKVKEYVPEEAKIVAKLMTSINENVTRTGVTGVKAVFGQQYVIQKGLKKFGEKARQGAMKELDQLHKRNCFSLININTLTPKERKKRKMESCWLQKKETNR